MCITLFILLGQLSVQLRYLPVQPTLLTVNLLLYSCICYCRLNEVELG